MRRRWFELDSLAAGALFLLILSVPFGTRYIWSVGRIAGAPVEWGTVSLYASQLLAIAVIVLGWLAARRRRPAAEAGIAGTALLAISVAAIAFVSALLALSDCGGARPLLVAGWVLIGALLLVTVDAWRPAPRLMAGAWLIGAVIQAALALWQMLSQAVPASKWLGMASQQAGQLGTFVVETSGGRWLRAYGSFGHPNILGFFLVIGLAAGIGLLLSLPAGRQRLLVWAGLPLIGAGLLASFSRSAVLAAGLAGLTTVGVSWHLRRPDWTRRSLAALGLALAGCLALTLFVPDLAASRLLGIGRLETQSISQRLSLTEDAWRLFRGRTGLGVGPGQMPSAVFRRFADGRLGYDYQPVHSLPFLVAVEIGMLGLVAWLSLLAALGSRLARGLKQAARRPAPEDAWRLTAFSLALAVLPVALFDHFLWSQWPGQLIFWLTAAFWGLTAAPARRIGRILPRIRFWR